MKFRELRRVQAQPGMTAMIDIIFLLLLFFVLSSSFIVQPGIKIDLPQTVSTEQPTRKDLVVIIARDKRIFVNNDQVTFESLWGRLIEELKFQRQGTLVLRADRDVPHGFVVRIMVVGDRKLFRHFCVLSYGR